MSAGTFRPMTDDEVKDLVNGGFQGNVPPAPPTGEPAPVPDAQGYETVTNKVVELSTPTSRTRFHAPNDKVEFDREKYEAARQERKVQPLRAVLPNPRHR